MGRETDGFDELALGENRDLWNAWQSGELTLEEAVFICRRSEFGGYLFHILGLPGWVVGSVLWFYDLLYEPVLPEEDE